MSYHSPVYHKVYISYHLPVYHKVYVLPSSCISKSICLTIFLYIKVYVLPSSCISQSICLTIFLYITKYMSYHLPVYHKVYVLPSSCISQSICLTVFLCITKYILVISLICFNIRTDVLSLNCLPAVNMFSVRCFLASKFNT
jgi:hypothetical protein